MLLCHMENNLPPPTLMHAQRMLALSSHACLTAYVFVCVMQIVGITSNEPMNRYVCAHKVITC